ncbi:MAG: PEGA domain-containing protein [Acidobacteria bacterium]|nr:PEGA domain-containing protein [Acidobacteriota bacterium]MXZ71660.1 PEGA domain-containing protein [Acidobacteriota bacterium]MYJ03664.1 PEGA domain-containing protein [Acidobacteriota bacterium]
MHQIGVGVLGPLFRAADAAGNVVAVKSFRLDLTPEQAERFGDALHAVIGVGLSDSSIVPLLDAGLEAGVPFLVSECVTGSSLDVVLRNEAGRPAGAPEIVGRIAAAVDAAHASGVMHGTLHLRDVIVDGDRVRVSGFGIANVLEHVGLRVPIRRPYAAPELVAGRHWGPEADRYALAAIGYELLTGMRAAGSGEDVVARLRDLAGIDVADRAGLQQAFRNGLAEDPSLRPASARRFALAFATALGQPLVEPDSVGAPPAPAPLVETAPPEVDGEAEPQSSGEAESVSSEKVEPTSSAEARFVLPEETAFELVAEPATPDPARTAKPIDWPNAAGAPYPPDGARDDPDLRPDDEQFTEEGDEGDGDTLAGPEAVPVNLASRQGEHAPTGRGLLLRSVGPVGIALVIGVGLAYVLGMEVGGPAEAPNGSSSAATTVADTGGEAAAPPPSPAESVSPPAVMDGAPRATAGFEAPVQRRVTAPESTPVAVPGDEAPAPALPPTEASTPGEPVDPTPARPAPTAPTGAGSIYVQTRPPGAIVLLDGERVGVTPLLLPDVAAGPHEVRFELPGYLPWATDVAVAAEEQNRVGASLQPDGTR